jgi:hypothetical protein
VIVSVTACFKWLIHTKYQGWKGYLFGRKSQTTDDSYRYYDKAPPISTGRCRDILVNMDGFRPNKITYNRKFKCNARETKHSHNAQCPEKGRKSYKEAPWFISCFIILHSQEMKASPYIRVRGLETKKQLCNDYYKVIIHYQNIILDKLDVYPTVERVLASVHVLIIIFVCVCLRPK